MTYERHIAKAIQQAAKRRVQGAEEYGDRSFEKRDMFHEMYEELLDMLNYTFFQISKVEEARKKYNKLKQDLNKLK